MVTNFPSTLKSFRQKRKAQKEGLCDVSGLDENGDDQEDRDLVEPVVVKVANRGKSAMRIQKWAYNLQLELGCSVLETANGIALWKDFPGLFNSKCGSFENDADIRKKTCMFLLNAANNALQLRSVVEDVTEAVRNEVQNKDTRFDAMRQDLIAIYTLGNFEILTNMFFVVEMAILLLRAAFRPEMPILGKFYRRKGFMLYFNNERLRNRILSAYERAFGTPFSTSIATWKLSTLVGYPLDLSFRTHTCNSTYWRATKVKRWNRLAGKFMEVFSKSIPHGTDLVGDVEAETKYVNYHKEFHNYRSCSGHLKNCERWNIDDLKVAADAELHSLIKGEWKRLDKIARASKPKRIASKSSDSR